MPTYFLTNQLRSNLHARKRTSDVPSDVPSCVPSISSTGLPCAHSSSLHSSHKAPPSWLQSPLPFASRLSGAAQASPGSCWKPTQFHDLVSVTLGQHSGPSVLWCSHQLQLPAPRPHCWFFLGRCSVGTKPSQIDLSTAWCFPKPATTSGSVYPSLCPWQPHQGCHVLTPGSPVPGLWLTRSHP